MLRAKKYVNLVSSFQIKMKKGDGNPFKTISLYDILVSDHLRLQRNKTTVACKLQQYLVHSK